MQAIFFNDFANAYIPNILQELYRDRVYAPYLEGKRDFTILDVGANIGLFSFYAYPFAKTIYSLEPSKMHFEALTSMVEYNKLTNVQPLNLALAPQNGKATFYHHQNVTMFSLRPEVNMLPSQAEEVTTMDMETLCNTYDIPQIDFMKLDVEGSEHDIISSESFEKMASRIKTMVLELHTWNGVSFQQTLNTLRDYGFALQQIPSEATIFAATR